MINVILELFFEVCMKQAAIGPSVDSYEWKVDKAVDINRKARKKNIWDFSEVSEVKKKMFNLNEFVEWLLDVVECFVFLMIVKGGVRRVS